MSNELSLMKEEATGISAEVSTGGDKGAMDENKIVSINKANPVEPESTATQTQTVVQTATQTQPAAQADTQLQQQPAAQADTQLQQQSASQADSQLQQQSAAQADTQLQQQPVAQSTTQPQPAVPAATQPQQQSAAQPTAQPQPAATQPSAEATGTPSERSTAGMKSSSHAEESDDDSLDDEERPRKRLFRFRSANEEESRDKLILSRIRDEDLMEYLLLEQRRLEFLQQSKEAKEKRLLIAFELLISLAAIVAITYLLQDNPTILISILYITGIVAAFYAWKNPRDKKK